MGQPTPTPTSDSIEASGQPGGPLCRVSDRWARRFLAAILYEEVTDRYTRGRLKDSLGFCREHAWQATEGGGSLLSMAIIYRSLLAKIATGLDESRFAKGGGGAGWLAAFDRGGRSKATPATQAAVQRTLPATQCPACIHIRGLEDAALAALLDALPTDTRLQEALRGTPSGFCLPHLRRALELCRSEAAFAFLQEITVGKLASLQGELDEFIRKYDHRFHGEEFGSERDSWERAVAWMVGRHVPK